MFRIFSSDSPDIHPATYHYFYSGSGHIFDGQNIWSYTTVCLRPIKMQLEQTSNYPVPAEFLKTEIRYITKIHTNTIVLSNNVQKADFMLLNSIINVFYSWKYFELSIRWL